MVSRKFTSVVLFMVYIFSILLMVVEISAASSCRVDTFCRIGNIFEYERHWTGYSGDVVEIKIVELKSDIKFDYMLVNWNRRIERNQFVEDENGHLIYSFEQKAMLLLSWSRIWMYNLKG